MSMLVVRIGKMGVAVGYWVVFVPMGMLGVWRSWDIVHMLMMLVVLVLMAMKKRGMKMYVLVVFRKMQPHA